MTFEPEPLLAFRDALYEALAGEDAALSDSGVLDQLSDLVDAATRAAEGDPGALARLAALGSVSGSSSQGQALSTAIERFETPEEFAEVVYFARWLTRSPQDALRLRLARRYVEEAFVPAGQEIAGGDATFLLRWTSFTAVWPEPEKLEAAIETLRIWREQFAAVYLRGHQTYNRGLSLVADAVDELLPKTAAVERLNSLGRLGPPVAAAALKQFNDLERVFACSIGDEALSEALRESPSCPECHYILGVAPPTADARRVRQAIERGLLTQQRRLAQRVVSRLLEQPSRSEGERLERFVQVVQASDLTGLALVLDDTVMQFLRDFLEPVQPSQQDVFERLAVSFPEVTLANLDAVVGELRRLLTADVVAAGGLLRLGGAGPEG